MAMCRHGQEYETCRFGCTFRKKEELKIENDKLKQRIEELEGRIETLNNRIYQLEEILECEDCSAKTDLPQNIIGCKAKQRIEELEANQSRN